MEVFRLRQALMKLVDTLTQVGYGLLGGHLGG